MRFTVDVKEVWDRSVTVELPEGTPVAQILEQANVQIQESAEGETEYNRTLGQDTWTVRDSNGNYL